MVFVRGSRAPRCDRCGRILAPYTVCRSCGERPVAVAPEAPAADRPAPDTLEDLIALALPGLDEPPAPAPAAAGAVPVDATLAPPAVVPLSGGSFDPDDLAIPREPDLFVGAAGGRKRFLSRR